MNNPCMRFVLFHAWKLFLLKKNTVMNIDMYYLLIPVHVMQILKTGFFYY